MIENTLENKAKFFAVYWGQNIGGARSLVSEMYYNDLEVNNGNEIEYINLRQLSSITDEDAIAVSKILRWQLDNDKLSISRIHSIRQILTSGSPFGNSGSPFIKHQWEVADFLRSSGYLLPWMGLTPNEIIGYGWAKCKEL